jgi:hypothetical protein
MHVGEQAQQRAAMQIATADHTIQQEQQRAAAAVKTQVYESHSGTAAAMLVMSLLAWPTVALLASLNAPCCIRMYFKTICVSVGCRTRPADKNIQMQ